MIRVIIRARYNEIADRIGEVRTKVKVKLAFPELRIRDERRLLQLREEGPEGFINITRMKFSSKAEMVVWRLGLDFPIVEIVEDGE